MSHMHLKLLVSHKMCVQKHGYCKALNKIIFLLSSLLKLTDGKNKIRKIEKINIFKERIITPNHNCGANMPDIMIS